MSSSSTDVIQASYDQNASMIPHNNPKPAWGGAGMLPPQISVMSDSSKDKSFKDLMSEDLAKDLQMREEERASKNLLSEAVGGDSEFKIGTIVDTSNDLFLAQMLQYEFDKDYDSQLKREERHMNKNCKLAVSFKKYEVCPSWYGPDSEDDEKLEIDEENRALDSFEEHAWDNPVFPPCGYVRHNNKIVTKHDTDIAGRKNAQRIMNFPPEFNTGDGGGFDMQIPNKVYNKLMSSAIADTRRKQRFHDKEEKATSGLALDHRTLLLIFKMINNSILESVSGIFSTGKESAVIHAFGGSNEEQPMPRECALKVFKTHLTDFKTRERYIRDDYRFKDRLSKNNNRSTIQLWAEKEFHNLRRLHKAKIPSPEPLLIKQHILVMSFIGNEQEAALKLKQARLSFEDWCIAYEQIEAAMTKMFRACRLVHGDMSEYNILWYDEKCWIIDLAQAVEYTHPNALYFLLRDCSNILRFFKSKGLTELPTDSEFFEKITGIRLPQEEDIDRLADIEVSQVMLKQQLTSDEDHFEFIWKEIEKDENKAAFLLHHSSNPDVVEDDEPSIGDPVTQVPSKSKSPGPVKKNLKAPPDVERGKSSKGKRKKSKAKKNALNDM